MSESALQQGSIDAPPAWDAAALPAAAADATGGATTAGAAGAADAEPLASAWAFAAESSAMGVADWTLASGIACGAASSFLQAPSRIPEVAMMRRAERDRVMPAFYLAS